MASETIEGASWLYEVLTADAVLSAYVEGRVFSYLSPDASSYPAIAFQFQSALRDTRVGSERVCARLRFSVRVVGRGTDFSALGPIASRMDALLVAGSQGPSSVRSCVREMPLEYLEQGQTGETFCSVGGIYLLTVLGDTV